MAWFYGKRDSVLWGKRSPGGTECRDKRRRLGPLLALALLLPAALPLESSGAGEQDGRSGAPAGLALTRALGVGGAAATAHQLAAFPAPTARAAAGSAAAAVQRGSAAVRRLTVPALTAAAAAASGTDGRGASQ